MSDFSHIETTARAQWQPTTPQSVGVSPETIERFYARIDEEKLDVFGAILHRDGRLFAERYWPGHAVEERNVIYSLSKSFTSCLCGIAISEGLVDIERPVIEYFPDETPENPSVHLQHMKVKHLLNMNTGHGEEIDWETDDMIRHFLRSEVTYEPGSHFLYHNAATFMVSAIIQKQSGQNLLEYGQPRIFDPLGIAPPKWPLAWGVVMGASALEISVRDIAAFGRMLLQNGTFNGRRVVPAAYLDVATSRQGPSRNDDPNDDWGNGYGYQFWRNSFGGYRGDGMKGQYCVIVPDLDLCLATQSDVPNMDRILVLFKEEVVEPMRAGLAR